MKELRPLKYTRADMLPLHERLLASGFNAENVVLMHDDLEALVAHYRKLGPQFRPQRYLPQGGNIRQQLKLVPGRLGRYDSVGVAFSGHGVQFRNEKTSYFCPADAKLEKKDSLIAFGDVFAALKDSQASRRLLLLDACQNDPLTSLAKSRRRSTWRARHDRRTRPSRRESVRCFRAGQGRRVSRCRNWVTACSSITCWKPWTARVT